MFTANLEDFRMKQDEMIRQAKAYRMAKLAAGSTNLISELIIKFARLIGLSGQQALTLSETK
jgi:hypothetical protein